MNATLTRRVSQGGLAAGLALALAPMIAAPALAQDRSTLRIVPHADLRNIDPIWTTAYITRNHGYLVWDTLFALDENLEIRPQMAEGHEVSEDGLTYTITLRPGMTFHDGAPVTAADAVASIRRWGARDGMGQKLMGVTESMEAVDELTFTLTLSEPYGLVLQSLGKISSNVPFIMPARLAETSPSEQIPEVIGSGPFRFVEAEWQPGNLVVYERFEDYVPRDELASYAAGGKLANVDRVEWRYIPDAATATQALLAGEVDLYEQPAVDLLPMIRMDPSITVDTIDPLGTQGVVRFNFLHPPFDNKYARQAVMHAVSQTDYMFSIMGNPEYFEEFCGAFFMCGTPFETDIGSEALRGQDLERARELLEMSGYDGREVVILDPTDVPVAHGQALVTAQALREIGMNVRLAAMDWATMTSRRASREAPENGGWNIFPTWWLAVDQLNPITNISVAASGDTAWFGWPENARIEELRDAFARETDPAAQFAIVEELQAELYDFVPYIPTGQYYQPTAYRANVSGVLVAPVPFFWNIEVD
ncbi:ABC transporter substrate-binding protein [Rhodobaculum claviforme]|uniref:ABC transporter substrate-binding protein n=1 Tax=Rhodobaculum claviforme TaxID=1549854 RepID=A0A934THW9_9RHOB|nr:ABC transporter substrate-binding protein [Rhodobaculum claviforme]MBK5925886.1 ABC transporter substrate-binding protein [Rhodobaculum claviforme]